MLNAESELFAFKAKLAGDVSPVEIPESWNEHFEFWNSDGTKCFCVEWWGGKDYNYFSAKKITLMVAGKQTSGRDTIMEAIVSVTPGQAPQYSLLLGLLPKADSHADESLHVETVDISSNKLGQQVKRTRIESFGIFKNTRSLYAPVETVSLEISYLKDQGIFTASDLPPQIDIVATVAGFYQQYLDRNFDKPVLVPVNFLSDTTSK